ncbi:MAG: 5-formyltetrahydrofolate cyclo-ligase [Collinsella sp.]
MDKAELRRAVIARRDALDLDVQAAKSAVVCARLVELLDRLDAAAPRTVAVYAAMGSEVDPAAFAAAAVARGWRVAYPCMLSATDAMACGQRMCMRAVSAGDASEAPFIAHPTRAFAATDVDSDHFPIVPAKALDMIIVPLVAFDQTGARLGYGGGCYDRYLPTLSATCQIIGIAFDEQRVDHIPTDAHDLPLPHIVSAKITRVRSTLTPLAQHRPTA